MKTCIRCGAEIEDQDVYTVGEEDYCEHCHDDLFVSWKESYDRLNQKSH